MQEPDRYIYRAPFVVPVAGPVIEDGALVTEQGRVVAVGRYADLKGWDGELVDYQGHALLPPLVNGHAHLELSWLAGLGRGEDAAPEAGDLAGWIRKLLAAKANQPEPEEILASGRQALARLYAGGCRAVVDIGNDPASAAIGQGFKTKVFFHLELLGLARAGQEQGLARLAELDDHLCCTGHAPYSTGPQLLRALKERAQRLGCLFPIHLAESADEIEFLARGRGRLRELLAERGGWDGSFQPPATGPVTYLDSLGVLDARTLCVHAVHLQESEIELLAGRKAGVCLCPGSNRFLGVGKPPLPRLLAHGILPALGTDSLASNPRLSLWEELRTLREDHPALAPATALEMATLAGARLLGLEDELGRIAPGVSSALLAVECEAKSAADLLEYLTSAGAAITLEWIE